MAAHFSSSLCFRRWRNALNIVELFECAGQACLCSPQGDPSRVQRKKQYSVAAHHTMQARQTFNPTLESKYGTKSLSLSSLNPIFSVAPMSKPRLVYISNSSSLTSLILHDLSILLFLVSQSQAFNTCRRSIVSWHRHVFSTFATPFFVQEAELDLLDKLASFAFWFFFFFWQEEFKGKRKVRLYLLDQSWADCVS